MDLYQSPSSGNRLLIPARLRIHAQAKASEGLHNNGSRLHLFRQPAQICLQGYFMREEGERP